MSAMKNLVFLILIVILSACSATFDKQKRGSSIFNGGDDRISFQGRFGFEDSLHPIFWAPGSYLELKFEGTFCEINLEDQVKYGNHHNYIEIVLDNQQPRRIQLKEQYNKVLIGKYLKDTIHTVLVCKNTESAIGYLRLESIRCKNLIPIEKKFKPVFEFIGNSITCGNGMDDSEIKCKQGKWFDQHNAYMSYGALISRRFDANWRLSAVSGIGLTRNCCGLENTMPEVYDRIAFKMTSEKWNFSTQQPKVVCVTLGQNDGMQKEEIYISTYLKFLKTLRTYYPKAKIICCSSPMANKRLKKHLEKCISEVIQKVNAAGDSNVYSYFYRQRYKGGCDNHPTMEEHQMMANELGDFIGGILGENIVSK